LVLDALLLLWVLLWLWLGVRVGQEVSGLAQLSDRVTSTGAAIEAVGGSLGSLSDVPLVGGGIGESAERITEAGRGAASKGRESRDTIESLSVLLGLAIALVPTLPVLALYGPLRLARRREAVALREVSGRVDSDPAVRGLLAERARATMPLAALMREVPEPWSAGDAELARAALRWERR
jgi:hypothetical protein